MEYALRHPDYTVTLFFRLDFPFFYAAIPQSCGCNTVTGGYLPPPPSSFFSLFTSISLLSCLLPLVRHAVAPSRRLWGVSE